MSEPTLLLLGGYGSAGYRMAEFLLKESRVRLVIAGRNLERAAEAARLLNSEYGDGRVSAALVDASRRGDLLRAAAGTDLLIVASSTAANAGTVAQVALDAGVDYFDIQYSAAKMRVLKSLVSEIERKGRCFITEGGFHPGLPAAMVRYAAGEFDALERALVASVIQIDWAKFRLSGATIEEFVTEMREFEPVHFTGGTWKKDWRCRPSFDFGTPFGTQKCVPMQLEEMRPLTGMYPSLREAGFFVGGFNWFVDHVLMLPCMALLTVFGRAALRPVSRVMHWGLKRFGSPPFGTELLLEASGIRDGHPAGRRLTIAHEDGYVLTAAPAVACLLQYLDGSIRKPGLWLQGLAVEPRRFMSDMKRMGVSIEVTGGDATA